MLLNAKYWITTSNIYCNAIAMALLLQFVIIIHNIPRDFRGQWFLANLKFKSELGDESFRRVHWPEPEQAWHRCWLGLISCESESGLLRGQPGAWRSRHHHHERLLNAETQKSCSAFCHLDYWEVLSIISLFLPLRVSYLASISQLLFCGSAVILATLHVGGNCMFAGTPSKQSGCVPMRSQPWLR